MSELTIAAVLEHYGADLTRVAPVGWRPLKCPFHDDRTASASVNLSKGGFRCHACGVSGDAIKLIMEQEKVDYAGAIAFAEATLGTRVANVRRATERDRKQRTSRWRQRLFDGALD